MSRTIVEYTHVVELTIKNAVAPGAASAQNLGVICASTTAFMKNGEVGLKA